MMKGIDPKTGLGYNNKRGYLRGTPEYYRNHSLLRYYKISLQDWEKLFDSQGRVCAICDGNTPNGKNWHTDHDHKTNKIRGILCGSCNTAIGKLKENPIIFMKALKYLDK